MKEQMIAKAYAKALVELGERKKIDLTKELDRFSLAMENCGDFRKTIYSGMFTMEEKIDVCNSLLKKIKSSSV
ncbi:MAG: F0F1 ATP synthase subunit delta, partial [Halobacteriovoraceae bacterium]|nr:F0F1 ATP synthase subunit delta [Halobacteriovoraceae bacterium]